VDIPCEAHLVRSPGVLGAEVGDSYVLLSADLEYVGLDPVGRRVWDIVENPTTLNAIVTQLLQEFSVDDASCRRDVRLFLASLLSHDLLVVS